MSPKFSVIIPVYNGADFIARTLRSVLAQEYPAHEIIVVDDGSTDRTPEILRQFEGKIRLKRVENGGVATARNHGMAMATGDYFAFLDSDDVLFKNHLKRQAEAIQKYPEVGFLCCNYAVRYPHHRNRMTKQYSILRFPEQLNFDAPLKKEPFGLLFREHFVGTASAGIVKREVAEKAGPFDPRFRSTQDYEYWLRCAVHTNFILTSDVLFYKKNHPANISTNFLRTQSFHKEALEKNFSLQRDYIQAHGLRDVCLQALSEIHFVVGNLQFEAGQYGKAFKLYWDGLKTRITPRNLGFFLWTCLKKTARLLTFGLLSRKNLHK